MTNREFLMILQETALNTPNLTTGAPTTAKFLYIALDGANNFTMRPKRKDYEIGHGGGIAVPRIIGSDMTEVVGELTTELYSSQTKILSDWALTNINAGQTSPWTTTELAGDLASCSVYHGIARSDGTIKRRRYAGTKATSYNLQGSADQQKWKLKLGLRATTPIGNSFAVISASDPTTTEFPTIVESQLPTDPWVFIHAAGGLTVGASRTSFKSLELDVQNAIDGEWFENRYATVNRFYGRRTKLKASFWYKPSPDDRADYEAATAKSLSFALANGTNTATFTLGASSLYTDISDDLDPGKTYFQNLEATSLYDPATATDLGFVYS
jgi:hypothetical protein